MKVLTLNAGSASLKFDLIEHDRKLFSGAIEDIGRNPVFSILHGKEVAHRSRSNPAIMKTQPAARSKGSETNPISSGIA